MRLQLRNRVTRESPGGAVVLDYQMARDAIGYAPATKKALQRSLHLKRELQRLLIESLLSQIFARAILKHD
jgi:hypothetical protein